MFLGGGGVIRQPVQPRTYVGPEDIVASASIWYGLRALSKAKAGRLCLNLRASGNNATSDFRTLPTGLLDIASIQAFQTANGGNLFVTKLYDQGSSGLDVSQATAANQPQLTITAGVPFLGFTSTSSQSLSNTTGLTRALPLSVVSFFRYTAATSAQAAIMTSVSGPVEVGQGIAANNYFTFGGTVVETPALNGNWHGAVSAFISSGSASVFVDFSVSTGLNAGTTGGFTGNIAIGFDGTSSFWQGQIQEVGMWPSNISALNALALNYNAHAFWNA